MFIRCPVLVGRQEQTGRFAELIEAAARGRGDALVVSGDPGIGKSRLVQEFAAAARAAGLLTVTGRAVATGAPVPLRPFVEAALSLARRGVLPGSHDLGPFTASLGRLVPGWSGDGAVHEEASSPPVLGEALHALFRVVAPNGAVLVLEDLHWADPESLAVVEYLCDTVADTALVVVVTLRDGEGAPAWSTVDALASRGRAQRMHLAPLDDDDVAAMIGACGVDVAPELVERAEGVPLFVEQMLCRSGTDAVPRTIVESVRRRVSVLGRRGRRFLVAAALCGRHFDWRLVAGSLSIDDRTAAAVLRTAVASGLLEPDRAAYRFHHALLRDAVLADATGPETAELAALLGAGLDRRHPEPSGEVCVLAADLAVAAGDRARAAAMLARAARLANRAGMLTSATTQAREGLELAEDRTARVELGELLVDSLSRAGRVDETAVATRRLLRDVQGDPRAGTVAAFAHLSLAQTAAAAHRWDLAEAELARVGTPDDPAACLQADLVRAMITLEARTAPEAVQQARALVDPALALGQPDVACAALEVVGRAARSVDADAAAAAFARAHAVAVEHDLELAGLSALHELGTIDMFTTGRLDRLLEARRRAVEAGAAMAVAVLDLQLVPAHYMRGEADAARAAAERAIDGATSLRLDALRSRVVTFLPHTAGLRGDRAGVERDVAAVPPAELAADPDAEAGVWGTGRGICSLLREDRSAAVHELETAARIVRTATRVSPHIWWGYWVLLRAVDGRDAPAAITALRSGPAVVNRQNAVLADLAEAVLLSRSGAAGRADEIVAAIGVGVPAWPWQGHLARRLVAEAALRDGWGHPVEWLDEAAVFFEAFGAPAVALACRTLVDRARRAPSPAAPLRPAPARSAPARWTITHRENEVLALLRDGLPNRDIARSLSISPRTVEKHVESLCHKLGVRGRGPLIALAAALDPRHAGRGDGEGRG